MGEIADDMVDGASCSHTPGNHDDIADLVLLPAGQLFELKERLAKLMVLGPWKETPSGWERPEAGHPTSRVGVWKSGEGSSDLEHGWHFRLGFGVLGIAGVSSRKPSATAVDCMARVDELLAREESVVTTETKAAEVPPDDRLRPAAQAVVDRLYENRGSWDELKEAIGNLGNVLDETK